MALQVSKYVEWKAGTGTPVKYAVRIEGTVDLVNLRTEGGKNYGDVVVNVTMTVENNPNNSRNSFEAADFALLSVGNIDPKNNYQFTDGQTYYGAQLPAPASLPTDMCIAEFRGDTYITKGPNKVSLWTKNSGVVFDSDGSDTTHVHGVSGTFKLELTGDVNQPILTWTTSGASPNHVEWLNQQTWFSAADFKKKYTLIYDKNGGSGGPSNETYEGTENTHTFTVSSLQPTRKHWIFHGWSNTKKEGWRYASDVDVRAGDKITLTGVPGGEVTKTIYAVWEYTYRPGQIRSGGKWLSCDRDTGLEGGKYKTMLGRCHIRRNGEWVEMRTRKNRTGVSNSPVIRRSNDWKSQDILGEGGEAHDVSY